MTSVSFFILEHLHTIRKILKNIFQKTSTSIRGKIHLPQLWLILMRDFLLVFRNNTGQQKICCIDAIFLPNLGVLNSNLILVFSVSYSFFGTFLFRITLVLSVSLFPVIEQYPKF